MGTWNDTLADATPVDGDGVVGFDESAGEEARFRLNDLMGAIFAGFSFPFNAAAAPAGFLAEDGSAVSRTTYARLFDRIGTNHGAGDGSTTFNLPDKRGLSARGTGSHGSATKANGSAYAGPSVGSVQTDQMQQITGGSLDGARTSVVPAPTGAFSKTGDGSLNATGANSTAARYDFDSANSTAQGGARTGDETRGAAAGVLWCIKT